MQKHLIIGARGNIGGALFSQLQTDGLDVIGTSQKKDTNGFTYLDLADKASIDTLTTQHFDIAYLTAGICRMNACEDDKAGTYAINVTGMQYLLGKLASQNCFMIYLSTNQVFQGDKAHVKPDHPTNGLNEYGRQKAEVEAWLQSHAPQSAIVRLTKVVEPRMALIQNWIDALQSGQTVRAFTDMVLAPISRRQVVRTLAALGQRTLPGIYHLSGERDLSYFELASLLATKLTTRTSASLVQPSSAQDAGIKKIFLPRFTSLDCSSTISQFAHPMPTIQAVLNECFFDYIEEVVHK